jgi:Fe-S-cluster containining protein
VATKSLPVLANPEATFDCIFGRGCEGICCKNGRPSVDRSEQAAIRKVLPRVLAHLRPEARALIEKEGFLSNRTKLGQPMLRVVEGWCVFFNSGCVLHKVGMEDGAAYQYKPVQCALFPLERGDSGEWYVRQWGLEGEQWDLFCLDPRQTTRLASESLAPELALAAALPMEEPAEKAPAAAKRSAKKKQPERKRKTAKPKK